jgi:hypothetical protein
MTRTCTVCAHPLRHEIDKALVGGSASFRNIAERWGLSTTSVFRHRTTCLPATLVKAQEAEDVRQALDVVQQLRHINSAALRVLQDAKAAGNGDLVLKAVDRVMKQVEVQARLLGDLDDRPQVNVLVSPEWLQLRTTILAALQPYPEARVAVAGALQC